MPRESTLAEDLTRKQLLDSSDDTDPATDDTDQSSDQQPQQPATDQTADQPDQPVQPQQTVQPQLASQIPDPVVGSGGGLTYDFSQAQQPQQTQPAAGGGEQAARAFQPGETPLAAPVYEQGTSSLSGIRSRFADELSDPQVNQLLMASTRAEVGGQGVNAQQAYMESVMNRASAENKTLADVLQDQHYYPAETTSQLGSYVGDDEAQHYQGVINAVLGGSNISNLATGNESGDVHSGGAPVTASYGGERFVRENWTRNWAGGTGAGATAAGRIKVGVPQAQQPTSTQVAHPQDWMSDPVVSSEDLNYQQQRAQQNDNQQVAQLAQATQGEQSVPGLIKNLDDPKYLPDVSPGIKQQYKQSLQNELTTEAQKTFNEPDPQKAYDKAMGNANLFTPIGETARLFQAYSAKAFNAWNQSAQTGEENTINQFINLINPNATPEQKVDFYKDLTDPSRSVDDRTHHVMALYSQIDPQISATIPPQNLLDAVDHQSDPQFVKQRQDFLKNEENQIVQREQVDPRLQGTAAGNTAQFVARMGSTLAQFGTNPVTAITGGSIMASELLQDTKQRIAQEHPEMSAQDVKALAETSTVAQIIPQAAIMMMPGGMLEKALGGQLAEGISNPVARIGARALIHSGIAAGIGSTGQIAQNLVEGKPVMQDVPQAALQAVPYGLIGALHGPEPKAPTPEETAPEVPSPPVTRPLTGGEVLGPEREEVAPTYAPNPITTRIAEGEQVLTPSLLQEAIQNLPEKLPADELTRRIQEIRGAELEAPREVQFALGEELQQSGITRTVSEDPLAQFAREQQIAQEQQPVITEPEPTPTTPAPEPVLKPEVGKTEIGPTPGNEPLSSIANKYIQEQVKSGELSEIAPGAGFATEDLIKRGQKMGEEERLQHVSDVMNDKGGNPVLQGAAVRAEEHRLRVRSGELTDAFNKNPNNVQARIDADNAHADLMDFLKGPVAKIKQNWHGLGMAMQGEYPLDLSTIHGLREQWLQDMGKPTTPAVEQAMEKTASRVRDVNGKAEKSMNDLGKAIENDKRKLPTIDDVADSVMREMGEIPCPTL